MKKTKIIAAMIALIMMFVLASCATQPKTEEPTQKPADVVTDAPKATDAPTQAPTEKPTEAPTEAPTQAPTAAPTEVPDTKLLIPYVTNGLYALYEGNFNTENGQDKESTTWYDLSGNGNDITGIVLGEKCSWNDNGLYIDTQKIILPDSIPELINSDEYTVEFCITGLDSTGYDFSTFLNSDGNDNFALFIRQSNDALEFKCNNGVGSRPTMVGNAKELCETCTIAVTFSSNDVIELYLNGEFIESRSAAESTNMAGNFFIGHPDTQKSYSATVTGIRFYDRVLTEKELTANYAALGTVQANPNYQG